MTNKILLLFILTVNLYSCGSKGNSTIESKPKEIYLSDLIEVDQIDSVSMSNNNGTHLIDNSKLEEFKSQLGKMILDDGSYKVGGIGFIIYINGNKFHFSGSTHGDFIETSSDVVTKNKSWVNEEWIYFNTNTLNLDNF